MEPAAATLVSRRMKPRGEILNRPVVLLVEDEPMVRLTQVDILKEAEFWVLEAQDADEAFEILKSRPEINVVLTDVDMPGSIDGFEFARLVRQGWPEVAVLVISGKTSPGPGDLPPGAHFLHKPVRSSKLTEIVQQIIPAKSPSA
jgi:CheY-like chemotaxis protein